MKLNITVKNLNELPNVANELLHAFPLARIFLFEAEMGCGKTTFIKELCKQLGSKDSFSSPTFSIVNEYASPLGELFHFDLYRLKNTDELAALGFYEYINENAYIFIEWPELSLPLLNGENVIKVMMQNYDGIRSIEAEDLQIY
jgi:tRNA threonylcarbamoyladenosine biosynthesis protein TsaE